MFTEPEERTALREAVRKLAASYGREYIDPPGRATGEKTTELWHDMGKHGYLGVSLPEEYGGGGGGIGDLAAVLEEAAAAGAPLLLMVVSPAICGTVIARYGTEEQKQRWLPGIADGTFTMAFAITEPDAGSNSHKITTTATPDGDDYVLNGRKIYISGVDEADAVLVVSRMADAKTGKLKPALFVVPTDAKGFEAQPIAMDLHRAGEAVHALPRRRPRPGGLARRRRGRRAAAALRRAQPRADHGRGVLDRASARYALDQAVEYAKTRRSGRTSRSAPTRASRTRWRRPRSSWSRRGC